MTVSAFTLLALICSVLIVLVLPFFTLFIGKRNGDKKLSGFLSGVLWFVIIYVALTLIWSLLGMDEGITKFLGTDDTVDMIRQTIMYVFYAVIETVAFIFICRRFNKKGETTPYKALRFAGGYALPETIVILLYLVLPLIVILSNGAVEFNIGETVSLSSISDASATDYLFKAFWRALNLIVYAATMYMIYTGVRYDAKWYFFIAPVLNLGLDLPYTYTAINSRKWTADTVKVINVYWKSERLACILMSLVAIIALIVCRIIYKNYYMPDEKKAALKLKKEAKKQKRADKKLARYEKKAAKKEIKLNKANEE